MFHQKKSLQQFFKKAIRIIGLILFCANILHAQQIDILLKGGPVFTVNRPQKPHDLKRTGDIYSGVYQADTFYISKKYKNFFL